MHKLEAAEATISRLSQAEGLRQSIAVKGDRPPKGLRKAGRLFRTAEHFLAEREQLTSSNKAIISQTPSLKEQLIRIRDLAEGALRTPQVLSDARRFSECRLEQVWAEVKLGGAKKRSIRGQIESLAERRHFSDKDWLLEFVDDVRGQGPVRRYEAMISSLESSLVLPVVKNPRV